MENTGFSDVMGSWKIIAIPGPRIRCISREDSLVSSCPWNNTLPAAMRAGGVGSSPMMVSAVTLLPLPLSPTMPRISPSLSEKDTSSIAVISPRPVMKAVVSPCTSSKVTVES